MNEQQDITMMCYQEFEDTFGNHMAIEFDHKDAFHYQPEHRLWTEFGDGHLESGVHVINSLRYIVSKQPYDPSEHIIVDARTEPDWTDFDEDAKERRINYMAKKMAKDPHFDNATLKYQAEAGVGWGLDDILERARKNADDDIPWGEDLEYFETAYAAIQVMAERLEAAEAKVKELKDKADRIGNATVIVAIDPDGMKEYASLDDISHISQSDYRAIEDKVADALYSHSPMSFDEIAKQIIEDSFADEVWGTHCDICGERRLQGCKCEQEVII